MGGGVEGSHFLSVCDVIVGRFPPKLSPSIKVLTAELPVDS